MHIPDGFLSLPTSLGALGISAGYAVYCHHKVKKVFAENEQNIPLIGCVAAFVFAAQMLNFPVLSGTSGHFMGSTLVTALFGPYIAFFVMTIVLAIQALFFGDGGLLAIGANIIDMAILSPLMASLVLNIIKPSLNIEKSKIFIASLFSILVSAASCSVLIGISGTIDMKIILMSMLSVHALIGVGEGLITISALMFLKKFQIISKDLKYAQT